MFLLIAFACVLPIFQVDSARLDKAASDYSQQSIYWKKQLRRATVLGVQASGVPKTNTRFTYSIDGERSCVHFKNESPKDDEAFETVSVCTPKYLFRLIKDDEDSVYYIDSLVLRDDSETKRDTLKIDFRKKLEMEIYSHGATKAFDLSVAEILNQNDWRVDEIQHVPGANDKDGSSSNLSITAKSTLEDDYYDTVNIVLSPRNRYAIVSYEIILEPDGPEGEFQSIRSGAVTYTSYDSESHLARVSIKDTSEGGGESLSGERQATFDSFSNDCDEAVFTLSYYGLSDSYLVKPANNRRWYLIGAALSGAVCVLILVQKNRGRTLEPCS